MQQKAVEAAIREESLLAVFPTGGGKSITFQVPALMSGKRVKGLTVVISPLQSWRRTRWITCGKNEIMDVVTSSDVDTVERAHAIQGWRKDRFPVLYIAGSLRSKTIERLLSTQSGSFFIDEAHRFSAWGQDSVGLSLYR